MYWWDSIKVTVIYEEIGLSHEDAQDRDDLFYPENQGGSWLKPKIHYTRFPVTSP